MASTANLTVYDGAVTPVLHTLLPVDVSREGRKDVASWREQVATVPVGAQVVASMTLELLKSGVYVVSQKTVVPTMESTAGANSSGYTAPPKLAFADTLVTTGFFSPRSTENSRRLALQLHTNLLGGVNGSVLPISTGPAIDLFAKILMPT